MTRLVEDEGKRPKLDVTSSTSANLSATSKSSNAAGSVSAPDSKPALRVLDNLLALGNHHNRQSLTDTVCDTRIQHLLSTYS